MMNVKLQIQTAHQTIQMDVFHWLLAQLTLNKDNVTLIKMDLLQMQMEESHQLVSVNGMKLLDLAEINNAKILH